MARGEIGPSFQHALSHQTLIDLCERAPDAVCVMDQPAGSGDFLFTYLNRAFEELYECDRGITVGNSVADFMSGRSTPRDRMRVSESLGRGEPFRVRRDLSLPNGTIRAIEVNFQPIPWSGGQRWMFITRDVTRERERHIRMVQLTTAIERGFDGVCISTREGSAWRVEYVNDAFVRMTGYPPDELIGQNWSLFIKDARKLEDMRAALRSGQQIRTEMNLRRKDGSEGVFEVSIQTIGEDESSVSILRDVSEARRREAVLAYEAQHDVLTGLHNRRSLEHALETAIGITRGRPAHALLFADLDGFKAVNDRLGHEAGDRVLKVAAEAFQRPLFEGDILARWGGDEFAAVLFHCSLPNATSNAQSMIDAFVQNPEREGASVSIGVVPVLAGESVAAAIARADRACYLAKASGRGRVLCQPAADAD